MKKVRYLSKKDEMFMEKELDFDNYNVIEALKTYKESNYKDKKSIEKYMKNTQSDILKQIRALRRGYFK